MNTIQPTQTNTEPEALTQASLPSKQQFFNPIPVVVGIVPIINEREGDNRIGLLTVRRGIEPFKGELALPGGYLEYEDWASGLVREIREETGIELSPEAVTQNVSLKSVQNGARLLIFAQTKPISSSALEVFTPNSETEELVVIYTPQKLAFPTHTEEVARFFENTTQNPT